MNKIILWDLDGLFNNIPDNNNYEHYFLAAECVAKELGLNLSAKQIQKSWIDSQYTANPYEMSIDVLVYEHEANYKLTHKLVHKYLMQNHLDLYHPNLELATHITELSSYKNYIVTHSNDVWTMYWMQKVGLESFFNGYFFVKDMGLCKHSNDQTYSHILQNINADKNDQVFMIDDSERNLIFAESSGIKPILFNKKGSNLGFDAYHQPKQLINRILNY